MARIRIGEETDTAVGWSYEVFVEAFVNGEASESRHVVTLSWHDHDHWTGGANPPHTLIAGLVGLLIDEGVDLPKKFDASTARRWLPNLDERLR